MNPMRGLFAIAALLALWGVPAFAAEHCEHAAAMAESRSMDGARPINGGQSQHHHSALPATVEEIPVNGGEDAQTACTHHLGEACKCKTEMALSCGMEGCCIKADGPLSTGLSDRRHTNDDNALSIQTGPTPVNGDMIDVTHRQMARPRVLSGPDPRPPSA